MWCLQTIVALNEAAVKVGEREAFKEVGIHAIVPDYQAIVPLTDEEKAEMEKQVLQQNIYPFCTE